MFHASHPLAGSVGNLAGEPHHGGEGRHEIDRQAVPAGNEFGAVIADPCGSVSSLPNQNLQGQIDGNRRSCEHQRRSCFRVSKNHKLRVGHLQSRPLRFAAMIDYCEDFDPFACQELFEAADCLVYAMGAWERDYSIV